MLLIAAGVAAAGLTARASASGQAGIPGTPPRCEYDEWVTYEPAIPVQQRTAWTRIGKVLIVDRWYRNLDEIHHELPAEWRASSPADAAPMVLVGRDKVTGMGNAVGDGKFITFTPIDLHRVKAAVFSPRKGFYGDVLLNPVGKATTTTAANVIESLEMLSSAASVRLDPARGKR